MQICTVCLTHLQSNGTVQLQRTNKQAVRGVLQGLVRAVVGLPRRVILLRALAAAGLLHGARALPLRRAAVGQRRRLVPPRAHGSALQPSVGIQAAQHVFSTSAWISCRWTAYAAGPCALVRRGARRSVFHWPVS